MSRCSRPLPFDLSLILLGLCLWEALPAVSAGTLNVKVIALDHSSTAVTVLLPMHHLHIEGTLLQEAEKDAGPPSDLELRVRLQQFYEAELVTGEISTTKPNRLRIRIPNDRPQLYRITRIVFQSR